MASDDISQFSQTVKDLLSSRSDQNQLHALAVAIQAIEECQDVDQRQSLIQRFINDEIIFHLSEAQRSKIPHLQVSMKLVAVLSESSYFVPYFPVVLKAQIRAFVLLLHLNLLTEPFLRDVLAFLQVIVKRLQMHCGDHRASAQWTEPHLETLRFLLKFECQVAGREVYRGVLQAAFLELFGSVFEMLEIKTRADNETTWLECCRALVASRRRRRNLAEVADAVELLGLIGLKPEAMEVMADLFNFFVTDTFMRIQMGHEEIPELFMHLLHTVLVGEELRPPKKEILQFFIAQGGLRFMWFLGFENMSKITLLINLKAKLLIAEVLTDLERQEFGLKPGVALHLLNLNVQAVLHPSLATISSSLNCLEVNSRDVTRPMAEFFIRLLYFHSRFSQGLNRKLVFLNVITFIKMSEIKNFILSDNIQIFCIKILSALQQTINRKILDFNRELIETSWRLLKPFTKLISVDTLRIRQYLHKFDKSLLKTKLFSLMNCVTLFDCNVGDDILPTKEAIERFLNPKYRILKRTNLAMILSQRVLSITEAESILVSLTNLIRSLAKQKRQPGPSVTFHLLALTSSVKVLDEKSLIPVLLLIFSQRNRIPKELRTTLLQFSIKLIR